MASITHEAIDATIHFIAADLAGAPTDNVDSAEISGPISGGGDAKKSNCLRGRLPEWSGIPAAGRPSPTIDA
jgi:hypothetical protein